MPAAWVTADEVYGQDPGLRGWLQERAQPYVLAVKRSERLEAAGPTAEQLASQVPAERWLRLNAGDGAKGRRLYDWARVSLTAPSPPGMGRWLLVRRSLRDPEELAFYACCGPAETPLARLVAVAGARWSIEVGFQTAKGEVGLDHYEVRRWAGWHRHITLALLAHAFLVAVRADATDGQGGRAGDRGRRAAGADRARDPAAAGPARARPPPEPGRVLAWSQWRRRHQARARRAHYQRRHRQVRLEY